MATDKDPAVHVPHPTDGQLAALVNADEVPDEEDEGEDSVNMFNKDDEDEEEEEEEVESLGGRRRKKKKRKFVLHLLHPKYLEKKREGPAVVHYNLDMRCSARSLRQEKPLAMSAIPVTVKEILDAIELEYDIPTSTQLLRHNQGALLGEDNVAQRNIKDGATLELHYYSEGDIPKVKVISNTLRYFHTLLKDRHPSISSETGSNADIVAGMAVAEGLWVILREDLFLPGEEPRPVTNKRYFYQVGGIDSIIGILTILLREPWRTQPLRLKLVEIDLLRILACYGTSFEYHKPILDLDGVGYVVRSFMRVKLRRGMPAVDNSGSPGRSEHNDFLIKELIESALEFLWAFRETTEVHDDITASYDVVEQLITIIHCPSFSTLTAFMAACIITCCAQDPKINKGLCRTNCIDGMMDAAQTRLAFGVSMPDILIFNYLAQILVAHVIMYLPDYITKQTYEKMLKFMERFLKTTTPEKIAQRLLEIETEHEIEIGWEELVPTIKLAYGHNPQENLPPRMVEVSGKRIAKLREYAVETAFFVLQIMLSREHHRKALMSGELDYLVALPSLIPVSCRERCNALLDMLRSFSPLSPPKLAVLVRAKLAKWLYGLLTGMEKNSDDMGDELYPHPPGTPSPLRGPDGTSTLCYILSIQ